MSLVCPKGRLGDIGLSDPDVVVSCPEINLGEPSCSVEEIQAIQEIVNRLYGATCLSNIDIRADYHLTRDVVIPPLCTE